MLLGILPVILFINVAKLVKSVKYPMLLGILPPKLLCWRTPNVLSFVRYPIEEESVPAKLFFDRVMSVNLDSPHMDAGIVPASELKLRSNTSSFVSDPIVEGNTPPKLFLSKSRVIRLLRLPMLGGIDPMA